MTDGVCFYNYLTKLENTKGCIDRKILVPHGRPFACESNSNVYILCCKENFCNNHSITESTYQNYMQKHGQVHENTHRSFENGRMFNILAGLAGTLFLVILMVIIMFIIRLMRKKYSQSTSNLNLFQKLFQDSKSDSGVNSASSVSNNLITKVDIHNFFNTYQKSNDDRLVNLISQSKCENFRRNAKYNTGKKKNSRGSFFKKFSVSGSTNSQCYSNSKSFLTNSGSGSGQATLSQKTVSRQIKLCDILDSGHFGEVWVGRWCSQNVAVKIFSTREEQSWSRECYIYQTSMLRHENILGFIASDNHDAGTVNQLWIVTDYHENGSVFDFLRKNQVDSKILRHMCYSISNGLAHLHMTIIGLRGKPAIAHRDLKSRNILVKNDRRTCCIADFGLAVQYIENQIDIAPNHRVGTVRYMAPEILSNKPLISFEAYKQADIYSLSLCFWEIWYACLFSIEFKRCNVIPYYEHIKSNPQIQEMYKVVVSDKKRPSLQTNSKNNVDPVINNIKDIISECWNPIPESRLTALRIKSTISNI
ncbi:hypothetical protein A3Q56_04213 [Intoshia linei]|uniref:receptor protein serine/threonine kinase n=1 Tax=Intoshia linei TaxID=1819745 RepID=A0A177B372_9BILA|nr:hypothetical protein A3Q56_04213 [Intoshia linei]